MIYSIDGYEITTRGYHMTKQQKREYEMNPEQAWDSGMEMCHSTNGDYGVL